MSHLKSTAPNSSSVNNPNPTIGHVCRLSVAASVRLSSFCAGLCPFSGILDSPPAPTGERLYEVMPTSLYPHSVTPKARITVDFWIARDHDMTRGERGEVGWPTIVGNQDGSEVEHKSEP